MKLKSEIYNGIKIDFYIISQGVIAKTKHHGVAYGDTKQEALDEIKDEINNI